MATGGAVSIVPWEKKAEWARESWRELAAAGIDAILTPETISKKGD